ncbi:hypothetical protein [Actinokineospora sp. NPDC004072]
MVAYSIEFADAAETGDPQPYGAVVLRLSDQDRILWHQGRAEQVPARWRYPASGAAIEEVAFDEGDVEEVCAYVMERDAEEVDDQLANSCLPYRGYHEPYAIEGQGGSVTVNLYGIG